MAHAEKPKAPKVEAPSLTWLCGHLGKCLDCGHETGLGSGQKDTLSRLAEHGRAHKHQNLWVATRVHVPGLHMTAVREHDVDHAADGAARVVFAAVAADELRDDLERFSRMGWVAARNALVGEVVRRPQCSYEVQSPAGSWYVCGHTHCRKCSEHVTYVGKEERPMADCRCKAGHVGHDGEDVEVDPLPDLPEKAKPVPAAPAKAAQQSSLFAHIQVQEPAVQAESLDDDQDDEEDIEDDDVPRDEEDDA